MSIFNKLENFVNPIHTLGLRSLLRTTRYFIVFTLSLVIVSLVVLITVMSRVESTPSETGKMLFFVFFIMQYLVINLIFPALGCTAIINEKEKKSYDLLVTTTLTPGQVVWGKFLGAYHTALLFLFAPLPLVTIAFLFGGITLQLLIITYVFFLLISALVIAYSIYISALCKTLVRAILSAYVLINIVMNIGLIICAGILEDYFRGRNFLPFNEITLSSFNGIMTVFVTPTFLFAAAFVLPLLVATNFLKMPSTNRSTSLRIFSLFLVLGTLAITLAYFFHNFWDVPWKDLEGYKNRRYGDMFYIISMFFYGGATIFFLLCATVFCTENPITRPFIRRNFVNSLEQHKIFKLFVPKWFHNFLLPGALGGSAFVCVLAFFTFVIFYLGLAILSLFYSNFEHDRDLSGSTSFFMAPLVCWCYIFFVCMLGNYLSFKMSEIRWRRGLLVIFLLITAVFIPIYIPIALVTSREFEASVFNLQYLSPSMSFFTSWANLDRLRRASYERMNFFLFSIPLHQIFIFIYASLGVILFVRNDQEYSKLKKKQKSIEEEKAASSEVAEKTLSQETNEASKASSEMAEEKSDVTKAENSETPEEPEKPVETVETSEKNESEQN